MQENLEQDIRNYFKKKYNLELTDKDYLEVSQSLHYLGKAIYGSLKLKIKNDHQRS
ncbi:MAG: hypothetical protein WC895_02740 [Candidatus Shapirobacteria bacterium]|jgi:hypothetical protein